MISITIVQGWPSDLTGKKVACFQNAPNAAWPCVLLRIGTVGIKCG